MDVSQLHVLLFVGDVSSVLKLYTNMYIIIVVISECHHGCMAPIGEAY